VKTLNMSMGDPRGIGPEIIFKSLKHLLPDMSNRVCFIITGDGDILNQYAKKYRTEILKYNSESKKPGKILYYHIKSTGHPGKDSLNYIKKAVEFTVGQSAGGLVTAPVEKKIVSDAEKDFTGHTEYIARLCYSSSPEMVFIAKGLKMSLLTRHIALEKVAGQITTQKIIKHIENIDRHIKRLFGYKSPNYLIVGLNPHAGDSGLIGNQEKDIYRPAINYLKSVGINVGPVVSAEAALRKENLKKYDFIVSSYHDQILPAVKTAFKPTVNLTLGLKFIRTSPDHGPAIDMTGKNKADYKSMEAAIKLAEELIE
jgi:4-hydroxythreonine-4-phosphate dehydrogenase